jgi:hypothetical protein
LGVNLGQRVSCHHVLRNPAKQQRRAND